MTAHALSGMPILRRADVEEAMRDDECGGGAPPSFYPGCNLSRRDPRWLREEAGSGAGYSAGAHRYGRAWGRRREDHAHRRDPGPGMRTILDFGSTARSSNGRSISAAPSKKAMSSRPKAAKRNGKWASGKRSGAPKAGVQFRPGTKRHGAGFGHNPARGIQLRMDGNRFAGEGDGRKDRHRAGPRRDVRSPPNRPVAIEFRCEALR